MAEDIEIDRDVPLPAGAPAAGGRPEIYPWRKMEVGDSFLYPMGTDAPKVVSRVAAKRAHDAGRRSGRKFSCRREAGGVRIWRTA